jgi:hypothetical protein
MSHFECERREENQRQNKERTEKEQRRAAHLFPDYQPPNFTPKNGSVEEVT